MINHIPQRVAIFDIDGTLSDAEHRKYLIQKPMNDWPAFYAKSAYDRVKDDVLDILYALKSWHPEDAIIIVTGREEICRGITEEWLRIYDIPYKKLYMRKEKDYRPDDIVKEEILAEIRKDGFEPWVVFEDRDRVVAMWRRNGILCCQVAEGNF